MTEWGEAVGVVKGVTLGDKVVLGVECIEVGKWCAVGVSGKESAGTELLDTAISEIYHTQKSDAMKVAYIVI